jgi:hypothetical protein
MCLGVCYYRAWHIRVVCHPLYHPQDKLVEYVINQVCRHLEKCWSEVNDVEMMKFSSSAQTFIAYIARIVLEVWRKWLC